MKFLFSTALTLTLALGASVAIATRDDGEEVIKLSYVTNTDKHPKGITASLLKKRVNEEMNGKACMEVFPNSTLYNFDKVLEAGVPHLNWSTAMFRKGRTENGKQA